MDIFLPHSNTNLPNRKNEKLGREQVENDPYILANTAAITASGQTRQSTAQPWIEIPRTSKPLHAEESGEKEGNTGNMDTGTCSREPNHADQNNNAQKLKTGVDPLNGLDAYGAELSKDARVWKVYVDEADRYDNELVDGWSKSLDLILVFAALFSAVSTAFIIESSKKLQPDPAEVSAETLSAISQTLLAIASNAQVNTQAGLAGADSAPAFVPSRTTVIINTLWYLSLSLSIATSLMAMLAKDWCRSFLANRTGDLYSQSQRRQKKWTMIERWKMHELLLVLPSLMHLSLLLFAVGLCIAVWELNHTVAIPVICVTAVVALFYAWSSIAASILESYPYTTIVSTINRSVLMRKLYGILAWPLALLLCPICLGIYLLIHPFLLLVRAVVPILRRPVIFLSNSLVKLSTSLPSLRDFCQMFIIEGLTFYTAMYNRVRYFNDQRLYVLSTLILLLQRKRISRNLTEDLDEITNTSKALRWLIEHCENPDSTSIALQAISGATSQLPREPLQECGAAQKILRLLTSSNSRSESVQTIGKYSRALTFLGSSDEDTQLSDPRDDLRARIGDWQVKNEKYILGLLSDSKSRLEPSERNLTALRTGSIAPSYVLQLLYEDPGVDANFPAQVNQLLEGCILLHPAAQISLLGGAALISAALPHFSNTRILSEHCIGVISSLELPTLKSGIENSFSDYQGLVTYVKCILALGRPPPNNSPLSPGEPLAPNNSSLRYTRLWGVLYALLGGITVDQQDILPMLSVGMEEILSKPQNYSLDQSNTIKSSAEVLERLRAYFQENIDEMDVELANRILSATFSTYYFTKTLTPALPIYMSIAILCCRNLDGFNTAHFESIISDFSFPQISEELITELDKRKFVPRLIATEKASGKHGHFAATQLWLLYALFGNLPRSEYSSLQNRLWNMLQATTELETKVQGARQIREGLAVRILRDCDGQVDLGKYTYRIVEYIYEVGDYDGPEYDRVRQEIPSQLEEVSEVLRHVSSFTPSEIWSRTATQPPAEPSNSLVSPVSGHTSIAIEPAPVDQNLERDEKLSH